MYLTFQALAVAMPILANDLFPGMTDKQAPSLRHLDFSGHVSILSLSSLSPQDLQGTDLMSIKLQLSAYIIWSFLSSCPVN